MGRRKFLGIREESGELIIGTDKGVIKARAFRRRGSDEERWSSDKIRSVGGVPWEPVPGREGIEIKSSVNLPKDESEVRKRSKDMTRELLKED